ncbi:hypothetical protein ABC255_08690 [Neobacillus sp. 3P2-tot-E-2]|uniref:hypothetical protein n=1 Tax=Neobacillus sp. 3P2-tot-E-2 TaxID=3132212 RepID=UPI0039A0CCE5
MKLKIIMDSGKEYTSEKFTSVEQFLDESLPKEAFAISYVSVDLDEKVFINGMHVSSVEVIEQTELNYDESDPIVY